MLLTPIFAQVKFTAEPPLKVKVGTPQASDVVYKPIVELLIVAVPAALKLMVIGLQVKAGSVVSRTVKVVLQVAELPFASVPVNTILWIPICAQLIELGVPVKVKVS